MNIGRFKNIDGECSKYVTIKKNSVFSTFCLHSKLLTTGMNRRISLELNPVDLTLVWTGKEKILYLVFIFTSSKQRRKKKFHVVVVHGKEMYQKACYTMQNLSFNFQNLLLFDAIHFLVAIAVVRHPVLSTCVNCWEFEVVGEGPNWPFFFRGFN